MSTAERARAAEQAPSEESQAAPAQAGDGIGASDEQRHKMRFDKMREVFAKQDRVKIRLPKDEGGARGAEQLVTINGYSFVIQRGVTVEVPVGVAEVLEQAGLI